MISKQTTLDLNGPILSFISNPVGVTTSNLGSATFTGIATATFPNAADNTGTISYRWYEVNVGALSDGTNISGAATTTLTLSNLQTPTDNNRKFYLQADYVPSEDTGNAINEPLTSGIATVTILPVLEIISQPSSRTTSINTNATFNVGADISDSSQVGSFSYQWTLNGADVSDGTITTVGTATQVNLTYSSDSSITLPADSTDVKITLAGARGASGGSDSNGPGGSGAVGRFGSFTLPNGARTLTFRIGNSGNGGGTGNFNAYGTGGLSNVASGGRGGGAGQNGWSGGGGGGGGASGVYDSTTSSYIIVAGGGGGGGGGSSGVGGGSGSPAAEWSTSSGSFSISNGGQGQDKNGDGGGGGGGGGGATVSGSPSIFYVLDSSQNVSFSVTEESGSFNYLEIVGIKNFPENNTPNPQTIYVSAGTYLVRSSTGTVRVDPGNSRRAQVNDGGGSWDDIQVTASTGNFITVIASDGSGGIAGQDGSSAAGGGGGGGSRYNSNVASLTTSGTNNGSGYATLEFKTSSEIPGITVATTKKTTVSGTSTPTLTISSDSVGIQTVSCKVSHTIATNSPIISNIANFAVISTAQQYLLNVEAIGGTSTASLSQVDLFNGDYGLYTTIQDPSANGYTEYYSIYSPDKNIDVEVDLYGGKGLDVGEYRGGEGGFSRVRFTLEKNVEYVVAGLSASANAPFIYRKGTLIACVGAGGNASTKGNGGFGGGIGVSGSAGSGKDAGAGGMAISAGNLSSASGIFGSLTTLTAISPDTKALAPNGGRALACPRGVYWKTQGISACSDVGTTKFRLSDGTQVTNTASIVRGFKAGYDIRQTAGAKIGLGGNGGNGVTGGNGGIEGGGGGGSGYSNGLSSIVSSTLGGSTGNAQVIFRVVS